MRPSLIALVALLPSLALAAPEPAPLLYGINQQGRLLGPDDRPVNGARRFTFRLYRDPVGGTPVWADSYNVELVGGHYNVTLGDPANPAARPLTENLFDGPLYLGVTVLPESELLPRQYVGAVARAARAAIADRIEGGLIVDATITGGSIDSAELSQVAIHGGTLHGVQLTGSTVEASEIRINGTAVVADAVRRAGDTMTGALSAPRFISTAASGAPLEVASAVRVDRLNAQYLDGKGADQFVQKSEFNPADVLPRTELFDTDLSNLLNNGGFENWREGFEKAASWWAPAAVYPAEGAQFGRAPGYRGQGALSLVDNDPTRKVVVEQTVYAAPQPALASTQLTLSLFLRRTSGEANAEVCIADSALSRTCRSVSGSVSGWQSVALTHRVSAAPAFLKVSVSATEVEAELGAWEFDNAMLVRGDTPSRFRPSGTDYSPSGMIAFFPGACPWGWTEYAAARGRTVVGTPAGGQGGGTFGVPLADLAARLISEVPAHTHDVKPPSTFTNAVSDHSHLINAPATDSMSAGQHGHKIDPPATQTALAGTHDHYVSPQTVITANAGQHSHGISTFAAGAGENVAFAEGKATGQLVRANTGLDGNHNHEVIIPGQGTSLSGDHVHLLDIAEFDSSVSGGHVHTTKIPEFPSAAAGGHNHTVDIPKFSSFSTGSPTVDVTMPYVQLTACQSL